MLPRGKYAAITWSIPSNFGGMTKAMLERSSSFCRHGGEEVDVLTFDWRPTYSSVRDELASAVPSGVRILNFWEELAAIEDSSLENISEWCNVTTFTQIESPVEYSHTGDAGFELTRRSETLGELDRDLYFRPDGSIFLSNELRQEGNDQVRQVRVIARSGRTVAVLASMRDAYCLWLDYWHGGQESYLIVDSKYTANWLVGYKRNNAVLVYLFHGSHLADGIASPFGRLRASRKHAFLRAHEFDAVCALTSRQLADMSRRLGELDTLHVAPNGYDGGHEESSKDRDSRRGVVIGRIDPGKRIDHAIRALSIVRERGFQSTTLDIFGSGSHERELRELVESLNLSDSVTFGGFTKRAAEEFRTSSFSILASKSEGFGLVLLESMKSGCIPIAYDVPYGPGEIIQHGINGFLVRPGDIRALAAAIRGILEMSGQELEQMRHAAEQRAQDFSHPKIVDLWGRILTETRAQKSRSNVLDLLLTGASVTYESSGSVRLSCEAKLAIENIHGERVRDLYIGLYDRDDELYGRTRVCELAQRGNELSATAEISDCLQDAPSKIFDVYLEAMDSQGLKRFRLPFNNGRYGDGFYGTAYGNMSFYCKN